VRYGVPRQLISLYIKRNRRHGNKTRTACTYIIHWVYNKQQEDYYINTILCKKWKTKLVSKNTLQRLYLKDRVNKENKSTPSSRNPYLPFYTEVEFKTKLVSKNSQQKLYLKDRLE
jgi:hypothetical protein